jgi:hypothetical protein
MLRDSEELLAPAVNAAIAGLDLEDADAAAVKLAQRYAAAIDDAARAQELAELALEQIDDDISGRLYVQALAAKVETAAVLEKLGPRLLAVLTGLGATPAARAAIARKDTPVDGKPNRLGKLRAAREA